jgi:putative membrane protein
MSGNERNVPINVLVVMLLAVIGFAAIAGIFGFGFVGGWGIGGMMGFGMLFMSLPVILIILLVVALANRGGRPIYRSSCCRGDDADAIDVLEMRYARGEISREEYLRMMEDLKRR